MKTHKETRLVTLHNMRLTRVLEGVPVGPPDGHTLFRKVRILECCFDVVEHWISES